VEALKLRTMLQVPPSALVDRFAGAVTAFTGFVVTAALVYAPVRFLLLPFVERVLDVAKVEETFRLPLVKVLHAGSLLFAAFVGASVSGLASFLTATEALAAAATIAFGFAAQDVLGNLVSGVFIVLDPKFNIGDWIQWKDREGVVEDISFRVTRVHTFDNELITVPNAELSKNAVTNPVAKDRLRVRYEFGIGYEDDIDHAKEILLAEARRHPEILDRPGARAVVGELAPSYVGLEVRFWVDQPSRTDFLRIRSEYVQAVKERFDAEGVEMPYPYRQLTGRIETQERVGAREG
jgi:small-conductance mechanosensitive channel